MSARRPEDLAARLRDHHGLVALWRCTPDCLITGIQDGGCSPSQDGLIVLEAADLIEAQIVDIRRLTAVVDRAEIFAIETGSAGITRTGENRVSLRVSSAGP